MRLSGSSAAFVATAFLCGCGQQPSEQAAPVPHGRYVGIGTYPASRLWSRIAIPKGKTDAAAANTQDDGQIIVAVDSVTGEIRECGNLTGFCIGMNPWRNRLPATQVGPVTVTRHEADLQREDEEANSVADARPRRARR
jgi:hypothetical protein